MQRCHLDCRTFAKKADGYLYNGLTVYLLAIYDVYYMEVTLLFA